MLRTGSAIIATTLSILIGSPPAVAQTVSGEPVALSLEGAVELALAENPRSVQALAGREIAEARLTQARSTWLPLIEASQTWSHGDHPVFVFGSLLEQGQFGAANFDPAFLNDPPSIDHYRLAVDLRLPIFDQLQRISSISQARLGVRGSAAELESAHQRLRYETLRAYYGVLIARRALEVAQDSVKAAESDVKSIRDRFETGLLVESDLLSAEVQLAEFRQQEITAAGEVAVATAGLRALLNLSPGQSLELTSPLREVTAAVEGLDAQIAFGMEQHPALEAARHKTGAAGLDVRKARARYLPRLDGFATYARNGDSLGENLSDDQLYGLRLSLNILEPGRAGRVGEARAAERAADAELEFLENQVAVDIVSAWETLQASRQRLDVSQRSLTQARESVRIIRDRYEEGLVTITEQLRAQTAVTRAELNHLAAIHDTTIGYARLLWATGRLQDVEPFVE